jgi:DNA-binding MarR family transcriptional regulator
MAEDTGADPLADSPVESAGACTVAGVCGQEVLPLIDHLARLGRRASELDAGCLRPRHLIALKLLSDRGPMTQHAFGSALSLDPSNVVGLLNELEERSLITRQRDPADRRRHIVSLSPVGAGEVEQSVAQMRRIEDGLLAALSPAERALLVDLLTRAVGGVMSALSASPCVAGPGDSCTE